jgi:hypothetical protein
MATVELGSLAQHLDDDEIAVIAKALARHDVELEDIDTDTVIVAKDLDDDVVSDFFDRLDAHEASADLYVPAEFDGVVKAGNYKIGSAPTLLHVLDEMKEELLADDEDDDEADLDDDDDEDGAETYADEEDEYEASGSLRLKDDQLRSLWRVLYKAAAEAAEGVGVLFVRS